MEKRMSYATRKSLSLIVTLGLTFVVSASRAHASPGGCQAAEDIFVTSISRTFTGGSAWSFSIYRATCEGLRIVSAFYTPAGGSPTMVLSSGALSQVHVPYVKGTPRFFDSSHSTAGFGALALSLSASECDGTRYDGNRICVSNEDGGYGWKYNSSFRRAEAVEVFMSSQLGEYNYINKWTFKDNGTIEVDLGLTGQLQIISSGSAYLPYGGQLDNQANPNPQVGAAHQHNAYYRLDFDINGSVSDQVLRQDYNPSTVASPDSSCSTTGQCGRITQTAINTEAANTWSATAQNTWIIRDKVSVNADGRNLAYELKPHLDGLWRGMTSSSEPWAGSEVWVTKYKSCERLSIDNHIPHIPPSCSGATVGDHVQAMLNSESVDGQDIVLWYANRHLHYPRDEDQTNMPIEWMSFSLEPRGFYHQNPVPGSSFAASSSTALRPTATGFTSSSVPPVVKQ